MRIEEISIKHLGQLYVVKNITAHSLAPIEGESPVRACARPCAVLVPDSGRMLLRDVPPCYKKISGYEQQVQRIDYAYTIQGWLKGVNSSSLTSDKDMGEDGLTTHAPTPPLWRRNEA